MSHIHCQEDTPEPQTEQGVLVLHCGWCRSQTLKASVELAWSFGWLQIRKWNTRDTSARPISHLYQWWVKVREVWYGWWMFGDVGIGSRAARAEEDTKTYWRVRLKVTWSSVKGCRDTLGAAWFTSEGEDAFKDGFFGTGYRRYCMTRGAAAWNQQASASLQGVAARFTPPCEKQNNFLSRVLSWRLCSIVLLLQFLQCSVATHNPCWCKPSRPGLVFSCVTECVAWACSGEFALQPDLCKWSSRSKETSNSESEELSVDHLLDYSYSYCVIGIIDTMVCSAVSTNEEQFILFVILLSWVWLKGYNMSFHELYTNSR